MHSPSHASLAKPLQFLFFFGCVSISTIHCPPPLISASCYLTDLQGCYGMTRTICSTSVSHPANIYLYSIIGKKLNYTVNTMLCNYVDTQKVFKKNHESNLFQWLFWTRHLPSVTILGSSLVLLNFCQPFTTLSW